MTSARSTFGLVLDDLLHRLLKYEEQTLDPRVRAIVVFAEIASTPLVWPLDDVLYEMLLTAAGFDLTQPDDLHGALWATSLLVAGDPSYEGLFCGHGDDPSLFCDFLSDSDPDSQYLEVMDLVDNGAFKSVYERRSKRCEEHGIDDAEDDGFEDAA